MTDERAEYLASPAARAPAPADRDRLDLIRELLGREAMWVDPPPEVADRLLEAIGASHPEPERRGVRLTGLAAAMAAVFVSLAVIALAVSQVADSDEPDVVAMAGTQLQPDAAGEAEIEATDAGWFIKLDLENLPAADEGTYYEGWVWSDDGDGVSIGTFHLRGGDHSVTLWSGVDPADYPAIWVTLEDEDGDPSASDRVVLRGRPGA
ncbi:MAG TPA: anti-sigma factor [Acidimicrobiia bacterium]|jgi:hypothetical protein|nr:anti-sigma factor [Acidimicrobiia bacterium]